MAFPRREAETCRSALPASRKEQKRTEKKGKGKKRNDVPG